MSDEQGQAEQPVDAWGQPISAERQRELQSYLDRWAAETNHGRQIGPFSGVTLTGADVSWLAEYSGRDEKGRVHNLHLEGVILRGANLEDADLRGAHLEEARLSWAILRNANLDEAHLKEAALHDANLAGASLRDAHLEEVDFVQANLEGAGLSGAHLEGANLSRATLQRTEFYKAHLEGANLAIAHLEQATLLKAHLEGADFRLAHLEGANLGKAHLGQADLVGVWMDTSTLLSGAAFDERTHLGDIHWNGVGAVDLTQIAWSTVPTLGDEDTSSRYSYPTDVGNCC